MTIRPLGSCADDDDWMRLVDGQLSVEATARLRAHAAECARCRSALGAIETTVLDLRAPPVAIDEEAMVAALMKRIDREATIPNRDAPRTRRRIAAGAVTVVLAAAAIFALVPARHTERENGAFTARGDGTPVSLRKGASFTFTVVPSPHPLEGGAVVQKGARFGGGYRNIRTGTSTYLLAFAIDARGTVHWLYPAYEKAGTDPESVSLAAVDGAMPMPTSVLLDAPVEGPMRLVSLLSETAHRVSEIESLSPPDTSRDALRARFPDAVIDETDIVLSSSSSP